MFVCKKSVCICLHAYRACALVSDVCTCVFVCPCACVRACGKCSSAAAGWCSRNGHFGPVSVGLTRERCQERCEFSTHHATSHLVFVTPTPYTSQLDTAPGFTPTARAGCSIAHHDIARTQYSCDTQTLEPSHIQARALACTVGHGLLLRAVARTCVTSAECCYGNA